MYKNANVVNFVYYGKTRMFRVPFVIWHLSDLSKILNSADIDSEEVLKGNKRVLALIAKTPRFRKLPFAWEMSYCFSGKYALRKILILFKDIVSTTEIEEKIRLFVSENETCSLDSRGQKTKDM